MAKNQIITLADVRKQNSTAFDAAVKLAFRQAAADVGDRVVIQALCQPRTME